MFGTDEFVKVKRQHPNPSMPSVSRPTFVSALSAVNA
jgi:hypothetical protein